MTEVRIFGHHGRDVLRWLLPTRQRRRQGALLVAAVLASAGLCLLWPDPAVIAMSGAVVLLVGIWIQIATTHLTPAEQAAEDREASAYLWRLYEEARLEYPDRIIEPPSRFGIPKP